ncbi:MAG: flavodoxin family protein [Planctomycetes bacterium]|nr:flavodoxin family protein [Planctomycetota bacterium]
MKVVAINGSPRKGGNTEIMIRKVFEPLEKAGIETELIQVGGKSIRGCTACRKCGEMQNQTCIQKDDPVNEIAAKVFAADGIILGSPTYFTDVTSEMKAIIDRVGYIAYTGGGLLRHKVGAAVVAVRRGGAIHVFDTMNHFFQISQMFIVGSTYWNMCYGMHKGDVNQDEEGMANMVDIGESMALLLGKLENV